MYESIEDIVTSLTRCVNNKCKTCEFNKEENCKDSLVAYIGGEIREFVKTLPDE